jgi:hypothetical protein
VWEGYTRTTLRAVGNARMITLMSIWCPVQMPGTATILSIL